MTRIRTLTGILTAAAVLACGVTLSAAQTSQPAAKPAAGKAAAASSKVDKSMLKDPIKLTEKAPATFKVKFETTKGDFVIEVTREWAPNGADRFYNLVKHGWYDDVRFFRVIEGFMAQFGIGGDPDLNGIWREAKIADDPVKQSNKRGYVTYAMAGPNTRTTQLFINFADRNSMLDNQGFSPFGRVIEGMDVVDKLYNGYGEGAPRGKGPDQMRLQTEGNAYLVKDFPNLDYIKTARIQ
jgi:peptidyl-prolyl cis-trans isomerase A (cyclophilin A)